MGYRHITESEFDYIKELLTKKKDMRKVAKISGRSYFSIIKINHVSSYKELLLLNKNRNNITGSHSTVKKSDDLRRTGQSQSVAMVALLKELANIRKAIYVLILETRKARSPMITISDKPIEPIIEPSKAIERKKDDYGFKYMMLLMIVGIVALLIVGYF